MEKAKNPQITYERSSNLLDLSSKSPNMTDVMWNHVKYHSGYLYQNKTTLFSDDTIVHWSKFDLICSNFGKKSS